MSLFKYRVYFYCADSSYVHLLFAVLSCIRVYYWRTCSLRVRATDRLNIIVLCMRKNINVCFLPVNTDTGWYKSSATYFVIRVVHR